MGTNKDTNAIVVENGVSGIANLSLALQEIFAKGVSALALKAAINTLKTEKISILTDAKFRPADNTKSPDQEGYLYIMPDKTGKRSKVGATIGTIVWRDNDYAYVKDNSDVFSLAGKTHIVVKLQLARYSRQTSQIATGQIARAVDTFLFAYPVMGGDTDHTAFLFDPKTKHEEKPQVIDDASLINHLFGSFDNFLLFATKNVAGYLRRAAKGSSKLNHETPVYVGGKTPEGQPIMYVTLFGDYEFSRKPWGMDVKDTLKLAYLALKGLTK